MPYSTRGRLTQNFSRFEWDASNFASEEELKWFRDARYGMFIHFGLSTYRNRDLSWGICGTRKAPDCGSGPFPDEEWQSWPEHFRLEKFDAAEWVEIARRAGFRYVVVIAKHHDGFHMWDTDQSDFKITNTPFGRDFLRKVADACHAAGMPFGIYYSQRDWRHPDYMPVDPAKVELDGVHWRLREGETTPMGERHARYIEYQFEAVRELCTNYGKLDILWWDASWHGGMFTSEMWDSERLTRMVRELQPGILMNNRCSVPGDFDTPENKLGVYQDSRPWETCACLEAGWSYTGGEIKSRGTLISMLTHCACRDGNLLLSWGPRWDGAFDEKQKNRLLEVGEWLKSNGESVHGTRGGPWRPGSWGGSTRRGDKVYIHIKQWRYETLRLDPLEGREVVSARLPNGRPVEAARRDDFVEIAVPAGMRDPADTIVELTLDGDA